MAKSFRGVANNHASFSLTPMPFDSILDTLARTSPDGPVFNQYEFHLPGSLAIANAIRRENLYAYWLQVAELKPRILLVGEAAGYRGCRLTGVPFTSEVILMNGIEHGLARRDSARRSSRKILGLENGYQKTDETIAARRENSATIVWEVLAGCKSLPLLWNAFPFHPHFFNNPQSNRPPTRAELEVGNRILIPILDAFNIQVVISVGKKAEYALRLAGIESIVVRHPSHGGKKAFASRVQALLEGD